MSTFEGRSSLAWWPPLAMAIVLAGSSFILQGRLGVNLADEGFLWYGVQRTAGGEVPLRDFQSYDPGRYYWCAAGTLLYGKGLVALRFSETVFELLGLWAGLLTARRLTRDWKLLAAIGLMLTGWMFPSHKLFDHALLLTALLLGVRLVEQPSAGRIFAAGSFIGLCTFFGRNHALYTLVAIGALLLLLHWKAKQEVPGRAVLLWGCGIGLGSIPLLAMFVLVPGFFASYRDSIESIFRNGANLSLPLPWLWQISYAGDFLTVTNRILLGIFYMALPLFYLTAIGFSLRMSAGELKKHALFVVSGFVGLLYAHHAFARADASHLAQASHPFTLGVGAALLWMGCSRKSIWIVVAALAAAGLAEGAKHNGLYQRMFSRIPWVEFEAGGEILIPAREARFYSCLRRFLAQNLGPKETLLIAPVSPGLYPILDRPSPLWELYFFFPATAAQEKEAIEKLAARPVNWALISSAAIDRRDDLRFASTHRLLSDYLIENFQPVALDCLPKGMELLRRKTVLPNESRRKQVPH